MQVLYNVIACYVARPASPPGDFQLLQLRRSPGEFMGGAWSTVRGTIEAGETAWRAALRELSEETALVPRELYQLDTVDTYYLAGSDSIYHSPGFCALINQDAQIKLNHEHDAWRWINRRDIDRDFLWPGERNQLAELCREILDGGPAREYLRVPIESAG